MKAKEIINWVVYFVCLLAVVFVINTFVVQRTMVSGDSMYPYLHNKDQLMMDKLSYRFHDPERFDIVVFPVVRDGKEEYYIKRVIGLPGEKDEDIVETVEMIKRVRAKMDAVGNKGELVISVNGFVPKPFTPYQWAPLCNVRTLKKRFKILSDGLKKEKRIKLITESLKETVVQSVLARGSRRIGEALLKAHVEGRSLKQVLKEEGLDAEELAERELHLGQPLPWQHLDMGVTQEYLAAELQRSESGKFTPMCFDGCRRCGVCRE